MSGDFDQRESSLKQQVGVVRRALAEANESGPRDRPAALSRAEEGIDTCQRLSMELARLAESAPVHLRLPQRARSLQADVTRLQREVQSARLLGGNGGSNAAGGSMMGAGGRGYGDPNDPRQGLLQGQERLDGASDSLLNTQRIAADSEALGGNILSDMYGQREQLENVRGKVEHVEDGVSRARKILGSMGRRVVTNNLILAFIILVLFAAICAVAYFRWINKLIASGGDSSSNSSSAS
jgi:vesicle transport through interaction with t-SNAREs 1